MFEKLKAKMAELAEFAELQKQRYKIDTSHFNDPIADKTDWAPLKSGGASFKTHQLKKISSSMMQYKLSTGGRVFISLFASIGLLTLLIGLILFLNGGGVSFFVLLFGGMFTGGAFIMYRFMGKPITFDANMGLLWIGKTPPKFAGENNSRNNLVYFSKIQAIQIISERVSGNKTTYTSYEINMVLKDGSRFNVVDHGNHSQILIDAEDLSAFLGKPIWNVS